MAVSYQGASLADKTGEVGGRGLRPGGRVSVDNWSHDFDFYCSCACCESERESNKKAFAKLSKSEQERQIAILADELEQYALDEVAAGRAEIVGKTAEGHNLFRFKDARRGGSE